MRRGRFALFILAFICMALPQLVSQQDPQRALDGLKITADQRKQVEALYQDLNAELGPIRAETDAQKALLKKALLDPHPAREAYEPILRKISDLQVAQRLATIDYGIKVRAIVGDDNWAKLLHGYRLDRASHLPKKTTM
jgi:hypothetical protein